MSAIGVISCVVLGLLLYAMLAGAVLALITTDDDVSRTFAALFAPLVLAAIGGRAIVEWLRRPRIPKAIALAKSHAGLCPKCHSASVMERYTLKTKQRTIECFACKAVSELARPEVA